jgi:hypothetical protein
MAGPRSPSASPTCSTRPSPSRQRTDRATRPGAGSRPPRLGVAMTDASLRECPTGIEVCRSAGGRTSGGFWSASGIRTLDLRSSSPRSPTTISRAIAAVTARRSVVGVQTGDQKTVATTSWRRHRPSRSPGSSADPLPRRTAEPPYRRTAEPPRGRIRPRRAPSRSDRGHSVSRRTGQRRPPGAAPRPCSRARGMRRFQPRS